MLTIAIFIHAILREAIHGKGVSFEEEEQARQAEQLIGYLNELYMCQTMWRFPCT